MSVEHSSSRIHVVAAVIRNAAGEILLAQRHAHAHLGGLWEFPGGKREAGEERFAGLVRELHEELGIEVTAALPLIQVAYDYPEKRVLLDVWEVRRFSGTVAAREGQALAWVRPDKLSDWAMPPADRPIVTAVHLPDRYLVTPEPGADTAAYLTQLDAALRRGVRLVQFRAPALDEQRYEALAQKVLARCRAQGARLLLNHDPALALRAGADGVHLNSDRLRALQGRPLPAPLLVAASCHDRSELLHAQRIRADFAVLGSVQITPSHPQATPLGWQRFAELVAEVALPVYALGGMTLDDIETSRRAGGQGVAAIRALWG